jgi:hypothetical protein
VTVLNVLLLTVMEALSRTERHTDEGNLQASFMLKFLLVRFLNTTIFPFLAASPYKRASSAFLTTIMAILVSEAILSPLLRLLARTHIHDAPGADRESQASDPHAGPPAAGAAQRCSRCRGPQ